MKSKENVSNRVRLCRAKDCKCQATTKGIAPLKATAIDTITVFPKRHKLSLLPHPGAHCDSYGIIGNVATEVENMI